MTRINRVPSAMTRINCVPVQELSDLHLGAEYRELPRVFRLVWAAVNRGESATRYREVFHTYTMGPGHVKFFYPRLRWVERRYYALVAECQRRGRATNYPGLPLGKEMIPAEWWGDWEPDAAALETSRTRINLRRAEAARRRAGHPAGAPLS